MRSVKLKVDDLVKDYSVNEIKDVLAEEPLCRSSSSNVSNRRDRNPKRLQAKPATPGAQGDNLPETASTKRAERSRTTDAATPRTMRRPEAEAPTRHARARRAALPKRLF